MNGCVGSAANQIRMRPSYVNKMLDEGFVNVREAQKYLGVSKTTLYALVKSKSLSHAVIGGVIVIPRAALREYAAKRLQVGSIA